MTRLQKMWNAMRVLKTFDVPTLQHVCSAQTGEILKEKTITNYCWALIRTGYMVKNNNTYVLVRKTGKSAIKVLRKDGKLFAVYDPNTSKTVEIKKDNLNKKYIVEQVMKEKQVFRVADLLSVTPSKAVAKFHIHRMIKEKKVIKVSNIKGYNHRLAEYKYIGEQ